MVSDADDFSSERTVIDLILGFKDHGGVILRCLCYDLDCIRLGFYADFNFHTQFRVRFLLVIPPIFRLEL